ncbi:hypothetical protein [Brucella vulpis]|uniref:hypothetical protein n=1 Tax=Brucella vulpis TaxID=981386 RepID=UPI000A121409
MKNPSIFGSSQKRGVLIPICSRFESVTFRESEAILTLPEVCQQSAGGRMAAVFLTMATSKQFQTFTEATVASMWSTSASCRPSRPASISR